MAWAPGYNRTRVPSSYVRTHSSRWRPARLESRTRGLKAKTAEMTWRCPEEPEEPRGALGATGGPQGIPTSTPL
eukprot:516606-Lingulodinium_polyedra.AAC.1